MIESALGVDRDGRVFLVPDEDRLGRIARKVAIGLYASRYRRANVPADSFRARLFHNLAQLYPGPPDEILLVAHNERFVPKRWQIVQASVFAYVFVRVGWKPTRLHCLLNFYDTVWAEIECPWPAGRLDRSKVGTKPARQRENENQVLLLD